MAAQLNYNYGTPKGVPGGKFDIAFDEVVTRKNENEDGVMKKGNIWGRLATGATPTYGAKAYVIPDGDEAGTFTHAADNGKSDSGKVEYLDISATFGNASDDGIAVIVL